jgi:hypothetical protein
MKRCKFGDHVVCPSGETCAGNQCCRDGSTCPSAQNNFTLCPRGKTSDCTQPIPVPKRCKFGDHVVCPSGEMCAGNQCCKDGSTCPSAQNNFNLCPSGKTSDCTQPIPIAMTCCEKAGGVVNKDGLCTFDNMLKCAQALDCDTDPSPNSGIKPLNCTPGEDGIDCKECQLDTVDKMGTRCIIPGSGGVVGGCYITDWGGAGQKRKWHCFPANENCKMTGIYDDCRFTGRCRKDNICSDGWASECSTGTCSSRVPGSIKLFEKWCNSLEKKTACDNNFFICKWTADSDDKKDLCCKRNYGDQAKWDSKKENCKYPCKNFCTLYGDDSGKSFWNCEG